MCECTLLHARIVNRKHTCENTFALKYRVHPTQRMGGFQPPFAPACVLRLLVEVAGDQGMQCYQPHGTVPCSAPPAIKKALIVLFSCAVQTTIDKKEGTTIIKTNQTSMRSTRHSKRSTRRGKQKTHVVQVVIAVIQLLFRCIQLAEPHLLRFQRALWPGFKCQQKTGGAALTFGSGLVLQNRSRKLDGTHAHMHTHQHTHTHKYTHTHTHAQTRSHTHTRTR
jgi:hypothetical protein